MQSIAFKKILVPPSIDLVEPPQLTERDYRSLSQAAQAIEESEYLEDNQLLMVQSVDYNANTLQAFEGELRWKIALAVERMRTYSLGALSTAALIFNQQGQLLWRQQDYARSSNGNWVLPIKSFNSKELSPEDIIKQQMEEQLNIEPDEYKLSPLSLVALPEIGDVIIVYGILFTREDSVVRPNPAVADLLWTPAGQPPASLSKLAAGVMLATQELYPQLPSMIQELN